MKTIKVSNSLSLIITLAIMVSCIPLSKEVEEWDSHEYGNKNTKIVKDTLHTNLNFVSRQYVIQLASFATVEEASEFLRENKTKIEWETNVLYDESMKRFVVQILPFDSKSEADKILNKLHLLVGFENANIVTIEK